MVWLQCVCKSPSDLTIITPRLICCKCGDWKTIVPRSLGRGLTGMIGLSDFGGRASDRVEPEPVRPIFAVFRLEIRAK